MPALKLEVISPDAVVYQAELASFTVLSTESWLGILPRHAPLIAVLVPCVAKLKFDGGKEEILAVSGGFMEVRDNKITLLVTAAEKPSAIDVERAKKSYGRAEQRIKDFNRTLEGEEQKVDISRAEFALARAKARLKAAGATA